MKKKRRETGPLRRNLAAASQHTSGMTVETLVLAGSVTLGPMTTLSPITHPGPSVTPSSSLTRSPRKTCRVGQRAEVRVSKAAPAR